MGFVSVKEILVKFRVFRIQGSAWNLCLLYRETTYQMKKNYYRGHRPVQKIKIVFLELTDPDQAYLRSSQAPSRIILYSKSNQNRFYITNNLQCCLTYLTFEMIQSVPTSRTFWLVVSELNLNSGCYFKNIIAHTLDSSPCGSQHVATGFTTYPTKDSL